MVYSIIIIAAVTLLVVVGILFAYYYNRFVVLGNRIENSLSQIDVQLRKRGELVPNLINTVKGYAKHEKGIMTEVTKARQTMLQAKGFEDRAKAGAELERSLGKIFAIAENYPQLKANENFLQLQKELAAIEDKIAYSRQFYNDSILSYNNAVESFPGVMFAKVYNAKEKKYLEIPAETRHVPKVHF